LLSLLFHTLAGNTMRGPVKFAAGVPVPPIQPLNRLISFRF
jgi:hypothetical protein